ncbi:MAG: hypothetical protein ABI644_13415 [Arenimonas sp.]
MRFAVVILLFLSMTACGPTTPKKTGNMAGVLTPESMVAQVRSAGLQGNDLTVAPLRDPQVEDLRNIATQAETRKDIAAAQTAIDLALKISIMDPDLLQWQAELFLLNKNWPQAESFAQLSYNKGPKLGALCRRNWKTLSFARKAKNDTAGAQHADQQIVQCTVTPPPRY